MTSLWNEHRCPRHASMNPVEPPAYAPMRTASESRSESIKLANQCHRSTSGGTYRSDDIVKSRERNQKTNLPDARPTTSSICSMSAAKKSALEDVGELGDAAADLARVDGGEAELEAVARHRAAVEAAQRDDLDVARAGGVGDGFAGDAAGQPGDGLQAGLDRGQLEEAREVVAGG